MQNFKELISHLSRSRGLNEKYYESRNKAFKCIELYLRNAEDLKDVPGATKNYLDSAEKSACAYMDAGLLTEEEGFSYISRVIAERQMFKEAKRKK